MAAERARRARTLGAPETVPAGSAARSASQAVRPACGAWWVGGKAGGRRVGAEDSQNMQHKKQATHQPPTPQPRGPASTHAPSPAPTTTAPQPPRAPAASPRPSTRCASRASSVRPPSASPQLPTQLPRRARRRCARGRPASRARRAPWRPRGAPLRPGRPARASRRGGACPRAGGWSRAARRRRGRGFRARRRRGSRRAPVGEGGAGWVGGVWLRTRCIYCYVLVRSAHSNPT
jgi:hypothetical protein